MSSYSGHIRLLVILVLFLALLTIASIILSVVSITSWGKKDNGPADYDHYKNYYYSHYGKDKDDKTPYHPYPPYPPRESQVSPVVITNSVSKDDDKSKLKDCYTIAFSDDWYRHEFIDEDDKCALKGWGPAIVLAACEAAGLKCKIVYTPYSHCIDYFSVAEPEKHPILGDGIAYDAIDGCGGWFPDQERFNVAGFTEGWIKNPYVYLWSYTSNGSPGANPDIGYAYASPWNEKCLKRYLDRENIAYDNLIAYSNEGALYAALQANQVQWAFLSTLTADVPGGFTGLSRLDEPPMWCADGEAGIVTRKCNYEFILKFNKGLSAIKHNGELKSLCYSVDSSEGTPDQEGHWCPKGIVWA